MFEARDIPYRRWVNRSRKFEMVQTKQSKRLIVASGRLCRKGASVQMIHEICNPEPPPVIIGKRRNSHLGEFDNRFIYDTISLKITD